VLEARPGAADFIGVGAGNDLVVRGGGADTIFGEAPATT
jgi:hypothetical protein